MKFAYIVQKRLIWMCKTHYLGSRKVIFWLLEVNVTISYFYDVNQEILEFFYIPQNLIVNYYYAIPFRIWDFYIYIFTGILCCKSSYFCIHRSIIEYKMWYFLQTYNFLVLCAISYTQH